MDEETLSFSSMAERIVWLRERLGLTAADLCRKTRTENDEPITTPSLWAIESGKTQNIKADTLFRIADALKANPQWILYGTGLPHKVSDVAKSEEEWVTLYKTLPSEKKAMILAAMKAIS